MSSYFAELDDNQTVVRVVVADSAAWCVANLGGVWVQTVDPYDGVESPRYCGPGYRWDAVYGQFFPWSVDTATGTLWCMASSWDAASVESQDAFFATTGLLMTRETVTAVEYVVFGGRVITEDDQLALVEVAVKKAARPTITREELATKLDQAKKALPTQPVARRIALRALLDGRQATIGGPQKPVDRVAKKGAKPLA